MIEIKIPGCTDIFIEYLVLDYNGTLAVDGIPLPGVIDLLSELSKILKIHIITADTHGEVQTYLKPGTYSIHILEKEDQCHQKQTFLTQLGASKTIAVGNGYNDHLMLKEAAIGIAVIQKEGLAYEALANSDLLFTNIIDALDSLRHPLRLTASLRR
jgi:soluble P-type ATPase